MKRLAGWWLIILGVSLVTCLFSTPVWAETETLEPSPVVEASELDSTTDDETFLPVEDLSDEEPQPPIDPPVDEEPEIDDETPLDPPLVWAPRPGDLKFIKLQTGDANDSKIGAALEFAVVMNLSDRPISLDNVWFEIYGSSANRKVGVKIADDLVLEPGGKFYFIHQKMLEASYPDSFWQDVADGQRLVFKGGGGDRGEINKTSGALRLVHRAADLSETEVDKLSYSSKAGSGNHQILSGGYDLLAWMVDDRGELKQIDNQPVWRAFLASVDGQAWLNLAELPTWEASDVEPEKPSNPEQPPKTCPDGYEIGYTGTCVKICGVGYERNPETNRCRKLVEIEDEPKPCQAGYERNPSTGRCRKIVVENELAACPAGSYRNPETGRCNKIVLASSSKLAPCPAGYERNPETNRCRKINNQQGCEAGYEIGFTGTCVKVCDDGYERNPETNRCRKLVAIASSSEIAGAVDLAKNDQTSTKTVDLDWRHVVVLTGAAAVGAGVAKRRAIMEFLSKFRR